MNKTNKSQAVFAAISLGFLILTMLTVILRYGTRAILIEGYGIDNWFTRLVMFDADNLNSKDNTDGDTETDNAVTIDWASLFPFADSEQIAEPNTASTETGIESLVNTLDSAITEYTSTHLMFYDQIVTAAMKCEELLQWNYVSYSEYNGIVTLPDGWLTAYQEEVDISEQAQSLLTLAAFCEEQGSKFLYIQTPQKITREEDPDLCGALDFTVQNADKFLAVLDENGIATLDLRELLREEGKTRQEIFYRTDHHWRSGTGLWAAGTVLTYLQENYGYETNPEKLSADLFTEQLYPDYFLGSQGKKVKLENTEPDDFILYYPTYETNLHAEIPGIGLDETGDISVLYDMEQVSEIDYYNRNPYAAYSYGDNALMQIENLQETDGLRVLLLHDSFGDCFIPFLSLGVQYVDAIDLRYFDGSLETFITETQPDIVMILYNPQEFSSSIDWTSHADLFDFR